MSRSLEAAAAYQPLAERAAVLFLAAQDFCRRHKMPQLPPLSLDSAIEEAERAGQWLDWGLARTLQILQEALAAVILKSIGR